MTCYPNPSWPEGSFSVDVEATAAQTDLEGCSDSNTTTTTVQVNKKPEMSITKPENVAVCQRDNSLTLTYTISSGASGLPFNVSTDTANCQVTPNTNGEPQCYCAGHNVLWKPLLPISDSADSCTIQSMAWHGLVVHSVERLTDGQVGLQQTPHLNVCQIITAACAAPVAARDIPSSYDTIISTTAC